MSGRFKKDNLFIERSLMGVLHFIKESIFQDETASREGFLQSIEPRIKAAGIFTFLLAVILTKHILPLFFLYFFCLLLALSSRINLIFFLKRTWIFIPLFSLFIALPALFEAFSPGEPLLRIFGGKLVVTKQGFYSASIFIMRVISSVSFVILLTLTTKHYELLRALRAFKVPQVFVLIISISYRYIYLFIGIIEDTFLAVKSRVGVRLIHRKGQRIVAWNIANLWQRSYQLNQEVYNAMLSRGYSGEPKALEQAKIKQRDWLLLLCAVGCALLFVSIKA